MITTGSESIRFCTEMMEISEHQLAALLNVTHRRLESWKDIDVEGEPTADSLNELVMVLEVLASKGIRGKVTFNLLNEPIPDYKDCSLIGLIVDSPGDIIILPALRRVFDSYRYLLGEMSWNLER